MSLKDLKLQDEYRSDRDNLIQDFYMPCLERATAYNRAVGFFSSTAMASVARGLTVFIRSGGQMRLVTSPQLSEEDVQAIEQGLKQREAVITAALLREVETELPQIIQNRLEALVWLLSKGLLEIKLAVPRTIRQWVIYYEKMGVFADAEDNLAVFTGSANETVSALMDNFECIEVYTSWDPGVRRRALRKAENFEALWRNQTQNVEVMAFPEAVARSLIQRYCPSQPPIQEPKAASDPGIYEVSPTPPTPSGIPELPLGVSRSRRKEAAKVWRALAKFGILTDVLMYSVDEIAEWSQSPNHVIARALEEGKIVYERSEVMTF